MDGGSLDVIYRAMFEENGVPKLGASASTLGIRRGKDIPVDTAGLVHRPAFLPRGKNGLSCSRTIAALPLFTLPVEWGGFNDKTVVWMIETADLGVELMAGYDAIPAVNQHVSIGPSASMAFDEYLRAIIATRPHWKIVPRN